MNDRRDLAIVAQRGLRGDDTPNRQRAMEVLEQMRAGMAKPPSTTAGEIAAVTASAIQAAIGYGSEISADLNTEHVAADGARTVSNLSFRFRR